MFENKIQIFYRAWNVYIYNNYSLYNFYIIIVLNIFFFFNKFIFLNYNKPHHNLTTDSQIDFYELQQAFNKI